jgi:hypothetical protein
MINLADHADMPTIAREVTMKLMGIHMGIIFGWARITATKLHQWLKQ